MEEKAMTKAQKILQAKVNDNVMNEIKKYKNIITSNETFTTEGKRLRNCTAYYWEVCNNNGEKLYTVLQSYRTVIAIINWKEWKCVDFLRYVYGFTSTSCQHISKFFHDCGNYGMERLTYREV